MPKHITSFTGVAEFDESMILLIFTETWLSLLSMVYVAYNKFICYSNASLERSEGNLYTPALLWQF